MNGIIFLMNDLNTPYRSGPFCFFALFVADLTVVCFRIKVKCTNPCWKLASGRSLFTAGVG